MWAILENLIHFWTALRPPPWCQRSMWECIRPWTSSCAFPSDDRGQAVPSSAAGWQEAWAAGSGMSGSSITNIHSQQRGFKNQEPPQQHRDLRARQELKQSSCSLLSALWLFNCPWTQHQSSALQLSWQTEEGSDRRNHFLKYLRHI